MHILPICLSLQVQDSMIIGEQTEQGNDDEQEEATGEDKCNAKTMDFLIFYPPGLLSPPGLKSSRGLCDSESVCVYVYVCVRVIVSAVVW